MTGEPQQRVECLEDAANAVDDSKSWQFLAGSRDQDEYSFWVVSKGVIPLITHEDFDGIPDNVTIESDPTDSFTKMHVVRYVGDLVGLEIFVGYIAGDLDGTSEGDADPIGDFRKRNPFWMLGAARQRKS